ncbi:MAG: relaxase/mobilization nuclease domain-containing protein [Clostridium sp.]|nr:relaxase/mobilization nuclease domain-containing protein [Clostridium sp.]
MSIFKCINGSNDNVDDFKKIILYVTDNCKTDKGRLVGTYGCSRNNIFRDMMNVKKAFQKPFGKQYEHCVWSITPDIPSISDDEYLNMAIRAVNFYDDFQTVFALHKDTRIRHIHFVRNSVNFKNGRKFSQSPSKLKSLKLYYNHILDDYNLDIIKCNHMEFVDNGKYSFDNGFDFLEIFDDIPENRMSVIVDASDDNDFNSRIYNPDYPTTVGFDSFYTPYEVNDMIDFNNPYTPAPSTSDWQAPQTASFQNCNSHLLIPNMVIDNSRTCEFVVDTPENMAKIMGQVGNIPSMPFKEAIGNVNIGARAMAQLQQNNVFANVTVDNSTNIFIRLESHTDSPNVTNVQFEEKK